MRFFRETFGFAERDYATTQFQLLEIATIQPLPPTKEVPYPREECHFHLKDGRHVSAGIFSFPSVNELRSHVDQALSSHTTASTTTTTNPPPSLPQQNCGSSCRVQVSNIRGESRSMHSTLGPAGGVVQVASQFNLLEFPSPNVIPEQGISGYIHDRTQGPNCAVAVAAATAYRNYLVPVPFPTGTTEEDTTTDGESTTAATCTPPTNMDSDTQRGQVASNQLNGLADIEQWFVNTLALESSPWTVRNGYIESSKSALHPVQEWLTTCQTTSSSDTIDEHSDDCEYVTSLLRIGVHQDATITDIPSFDQTVTHTYNSALSIGYSKHVSTEQWEPLAKLVLKGTYEATLLVGILEAVRAKSHHKPIPPIYLTKVGGGVFGNQQRWICEAIQHAIDRTTRYSQHLGVDLDVRIVHHGKIDSTYRSLESFSK